MLTRLLSWSQSPSQTSPSESRRESSPSSSSIAETSSYKSSSRERDLLHLPDELVLEILSYFPEGQESQSSLWACCLVSHQWHNLAISKLYADPYLYGWNYDPFVRTICPSKNAHVRKSDLAGLVKTLDMSKLAYQGSKSTTARVLGRTKNSLQIFVAPAANWGVNCLAALSRCELLESLDLSLLSEAMSYRELSQTIRNMRELRVLRFPRSGSKHSQTTTRTHMQWPPLLEELSLSGELDDFVSNDVFPATPNVPTAVTKLLIQHSRIDYNSFTLILKRMGPQLTYLGLRQLPSFTASTPEGQYPLSEVITNCPHLQNLEIDRDLVAFYPIVLQPSHETLIHEPWLLHPLQHLYVTSVGRMARYDRTESHAAFDIAAAIERRILPLLKIVTFEYGIKKQDLWTEEMRDLDQKLKTQARINGQSEKGAGVRFRILLP